MQAGSSPASPPDSKARMLRKLADEAEVVFAINANDIEQGKRRSDIGITYDEDVLRLMDVFRGMGLAIGGVVITCFSGQRKAEIYQGPSRVPGHSRVSSLPHRWISLRHRQNRLGRGLRCRNDYIRPRGPLVVVTAPRSRLRQACRVPCLSFTTSMPMA